MTSLPHLKSERLVLRLAGERDVPAILDYYTANRAFLEPFEPLKPPSFYTVAYWEDQVLRNIDDFRHGRSVRLFLFSRPDPSRIVGFVGISNIVRGAAHFASVGYSLAEKEQGQGYMTEAMRAAIGYAFGPLNLHRLGANYMPRNLRSAALLERLGFRKEGHAWDYLRINGMWEDHVLTSLINPDWRAD